MLANFHVWGIMFLLRAVLNILMRNAIPRGPMCFRCLIFNLPGPLSCFFLVFLYCLLDLRSGECNVVSLYVLCCPVNGSVCFGCCLFVNCLVIFYSKHLINSSIYPDELKLSKIIPIDKSGDKTAASNYIQISVLSFFSTMFISTCWNFINDNDFCKFQFRF